MYMQLSAMDSTANYVSVGSFIWVQCLQEKLLTFGNGANWRQNRNKLQLDKILLSRICCDEEHKHCDGKSPCLTTIPGKKQFSDLFS